MMWKAIGKSVTGTSHMAAGRGCEDALNLSLSTGENGEEVLLCCISDGAGSAQYAAYASSHIARRCVELMEEMCMHGDISEAAIFNIAEVIFNELQNEAAHTGSPLEEYAATILACAVTKSKSAFLQIGDGAIVRKGDGGNYQLAWWPHSGEYHNTTSFLVDDANMPNLKVLVTDDPVNEIAMLTDGLQMLALSTETRAAHAPFFEGLFAPLRHATDQRKLETLNEKLGEWLNSPAINNRTDDDKTLFLATRLSP